MELSIIVPTFNEAPNIAEFVRRTEAACLGIDAEIVFVDDFHDATPQAILNVASGSAMPVRLIHREVPTGGLSGAVIAGIRSSEAVYALVMDGDLQHPPEMIPVILARLQESGADVVVASRYCVNGGSAAGLSNGTRRLVSSGSTLLTRSLFPVRLKECSDPMTGFFGFRRSTVQVDCLKPTGFKILLEILARNSLRVVEVPFIFGERFAGESKATLGEGMRFIRQLGSLRFGRIASFGLVGAIGAVLNLLIMGVLVFAEVHYVTAAVIAAETTILTNFLMQERMVFHADRDKAHPIRRRFLQSFGFNNVDAAARLPVLWALVEYGGMASLVAQAGTLAVAFLLRYLFHARVVYGVAHASPVFQAAVHQSRFGVIPVPRRQQADMPPA
ncbi:glycosyltransferase family 2 protein [Kocuria sp. CPCC 205292]|uniref:glycosyltransferase n=1 Tax=Kocuria cellulosilytica TaxID=3071451 RepID=UPI0034D5C00A